MRNLPSLRALCTLMLAALAAASTTASKAQLVSALPDADPRSGRFINVTRGLSSIGENGASIGLIAPTTQANLQFSIFDGDLGGKWDPVPSTGILDVVRFTLYADPLGVADTSPGNLLDEWLSTAMPDDAWLDFTVPRAASAFNPAQGHYRYNLRVTWLTTGNTSEQNNFKIRTVGAACATSRSSFGFIGYAPNDIDQVKYPNTTFNGQWNFYLDISAAPTGITLWNGDFDLKNDTDDPNSSMNPPFAYIWVYGFGENSKMGEPADTDIGQSLTSPDGKWTITDPNPSGNTEWEMLSVRLDPTVTAATYANPADLGDMDWKVPSMPAGLYRWQIIGADGRNTLFLHPDYDLYGASQLGDFVWEDTNANGLQDAGEPGVANVTVQLLDATSAVIATTTTDAAGAYGFDNLVPGTYSVRFALPAGYVFTVAGAGTNPEANSHAGTGGLTEQVILGPGQSAFFLDAGLVRRGSLGDYVWEDMNYNGVQDLGEPAVGGVKVELLDSAGAVQATATTAADGLYSFTGLVPGSYSVRFVRPAGYEFTQKAGDPNSATQSHADTVTGATEAYDVPAGGKITILDAGLIRVASLGDRVWLDANRNGLQDAGEAGVAGVDVKLLDEGGVVIAANTTGADGSYLFSELTPGTYSVAFTAPAGYTFTTPGAGANREADSDADQATGATGSVTLVSGDNVRLLDAGLITTTGIFTTYTQGGWGAKPSGNNPGMLLATYFTTLYPNGVTVGTSYTLKFTSASAIEVFLPQGGTAKALTASAVNPTGKISVLAGQVLAMRLSLDFSAAGITRIGLAALTVQSGPFKGMTAGQLYEIANKALGGGGTGIYTIAQINDAATAFNENFDNGTTNNGFLK